MALVIRPHHRHAFSDLLDQMYRLRHRVFVERLGWTLDTDGIHEIDQFDDGGCLHMVALDADGQVRATTRLTPSQEPNVTCDVLETQMDGRFPRGPHIIEVSRHCVDPDLGKAERDDILLDLRRSQAELSDACGWSHKLGVSYDRHIQPWIRSGFNVEILGAPFRFPGDAEYSFGWMVSRNAAHPSLILDLLEARRKYLQDPDTDPGLLVRYGDRVLREA